ncbi:hypothetical protein MSPP1_004126 [Malassezia sp. CBS 17886]|nr:hypothetical protein MSPP1_004126 [Malassezia sp. CBS 17886]
MPPGQEYADGTDAGLSAHRITLHDEGAGASAPALMESHHEGKGTASAAPGDRICITDAVASTASTTSTYIVYVIAAPHSDARRRYSEFEALRDALIALHPTQLVPPIPSKHTLADYALKQGRAKNDAGVIAKRRRLLQRFLNRVAAHPVLGVDPVFQRFLDGRLAWHEIERSPPLSNLPKSTLAAPPQDPAATDAPACYRALPVPTSARKLRVQNTRFQDSEAFTNRFESHMAGTLEPANRRLVRRWSDIANDYVELGALLNAHSLAEAQTIAAALERAGQAADAACINTNDMLHAWDAHVTEPLHEYTQYAETLQQIIRWRHLKHQQLEEAQDMLAEKRQRLLELERVEADSLRLSVALENGGRGLVSQSPHSFGGAHAMRHSVYGAPPGPPPTRRGLLASITDKLQSIVDLGPEKTRQSTISRLREDVILLEEGVHVAARDLELVTTTIQASLDRFQRLKVADLRSLMLEFARMHRDYCQKVDHISSDAWEGQPDAHMTPTPRTPSQWRSDT